MAPPVLAVFTDGQPRLVTIDEMRELIGVADLQRKLATYMTSAEDRLTSVSGMSQQSIRQTRNDIQTAFDRIEPIETNISALKEARVDADAGLAALDRTVIDLGAARRQIERDAGRIDEAVLRLLSEAGRTRQVLRDAGIVVDPATGMVRIYALDQLATRTARAELTLDAQKALITQKASVDQVHELISAAVLDPVQIAKLEPIIRRLSEAELAINGLNASITLKADLLELTRLGGKVTTLRADLDAVAGTVTLKAEKSVVDKLATDVGAAQLSLQALGDMSSYSVTVRQARARADNGAEAALRTLIAGDTASRRQIVQAAEARQEVEAKIVDLRSAVAAARLTLGVQIEQVDARAVQETTARIDGDRALAEDIRALGVVDQDQAAAIGRLERAAIAADGGIASVTTTIRQQIRKTDDDAKGLLRALIAGDQVGRARAAQLVQIQTELSTRLVANEQASAIARQSLLARMIHAEAAIVETARVAAEASHATAEKLSALEAAFNDGSTGLKATAAALAAQITLSSEQNAARAEEIRVLRSTVYDPATGLAAAHAGVARSDKAITDLGRTTGAAIEQVSASIGGVSSRVDSLSEVVVGSDGAIARAVVRLDVNGRVSGTVQTNNGKTSSFGVRADNFGVYDTNGKLLFFVDTDGAIAASFKRSAIGYDHLDMGSAQRVAWYSVAQDVSVERGVTVQIVSITFDKIDADSALKICFYGNISSPDDLQFIGAIAIDGATVQPVAVNIVLDNANSSGRMPITPFAFVSGIAAGRHTVTFTLTNTETDNVPLTVRQGSTLEVTELRKASLGSVTGSGAVVVDGGGGGGGTGGGGGYRGGGTSPSLPQQ